MSAPLTYGIAANAKNADCAAFFLNWVATNETARQINVDRRRLEPWRSGRLPIPTVAAGSVTNETLAAGNEVAKDNGAMDFIANATGSIFAQGWTPELQKMVGGKQDAAGLLKAVQAEYAEGTEPLTQAADQASRSDGDRGSPARADVGGSPAGPRDRGVRRRPGRAGCSCSPPSRSTASSSSSRSR